MDVEATMANEPLKTVCVGHFLVDVPRNAVVRATGSYWAVKVSRHDDKDFASLEREIKGKAAGFEGQKIERNDRRDRLYRAAGLEPDQLYTTSTRLIEMQSNAAEQYVAIGFHEDASKPGIVADVHRIIDRKHYQFSTSNVGADKYPAVRDSVLSAATRYTPLQQGEVPTQPGFCIGDGLFQEEGPRDVGGDVTMVVRFPDMPNVTFSIDISGLVERPNDPPLKDRVSDDLGLLARFSSNVKTLRRGDARYADQPGYEIGVSAPGEDAPSARMQKFFFAAEGKVDDPSHPALEVQLITGESGPSPLMDEEAGALWLQLINSLRLRSGSI